MSVSWKVVAALVFMHPTASPAVWVNEFRSSLFGRVDVIEEATIDELLRVDGFISIPLWQAVSMRMC